MDELKQLCNSRKGYRLHLNKLLTKAKEMLDHYQTFETEFNTATLTDICRQLQQKDDIISKLDSQIVPLIGDEEELVTDVCEAEEIKESLSTTISQIMEILETHSPSTEPQFPQPKPSVNPDSQSDHSQDVTTQIDQHNIEQTEESRTAQPPPPTQPRPVIQGVTHLAKLSIPTFSEPVTVAVFLGLF